MSDRTCTIGDCKRPHDARGMCSMHVQRARKWGDPEYRAARYRGDVIRDLRALLASPTDDCQFLEGRYGRRTLAVYEGKTTNAARVVWWMTDGDPGDLSVLHTCDRGDVGCVNRRHLYLGTQARNVQDAVERGRISRGERHPSARLTALQVEEIRDLCRLALTQNEVAQAYGISQRQVSRIVRGENWTVERLVAAERERVG